MGQAPQGRGVTAGPRRRKGKHPFTAYMVEVNDDGYPIREGRERPGRATLSMPVFDLVEEVRSRHPAVVRLREARVMAHQARVAVEEREWKAAHPKRRPGKAPSKPSKASAGVGCYLDTTQPAKAAESILEPLPPKPPREGGSLDVDVDVDTTVERTVDRGVERHVDRTVDRTVERTVDRSVDRTVDRSQDGPDLWRIPNLPGVLYMEDL